MLRITKIEFNDYTFQFVDYSNSLNPSALEKITNIFLKPEDAYEKLRFDSKAAVDALDRFSRRCCTIPSDPVAKEGDKTISEAFKDYSLAAVGAFDALRSKESAYDKNGDPYKNVSIILYQLGKEGSDTNTCFLDTAPQAERKKIAEYNFKFNNAIEAVYSIFNSR